MLSSFNGEYRPALDNLYQLNLRIFRVWVGENDDEGGSRRMKKGRFSPEQIIGVLKQHEAGRKVQELARERPGGESTRDRFLP